MWVGHKTNNMLSVIETSVHNVCDLNSEFYNELIYSFSPSLGMYFCGISFERQSSL